jgi:hypothetical protein
MNACTVDLIPHEDVDKEEFRENDAFRATALGVERQLRRRRAECTTNVFANVSSIPWNTVGSDTK